MKILIYSLFSPPELTGIGKYNGEMIAWFAEHGHKIDIVTTFPFYPDWEVSDKYKKKIFTVEDQDKNIRIYRSWSYVPAKVTGLSRICQEITFAVTSMANITKILINNEYDICMTIAPPFHLALLAQPISNLKNILHVYHIQDLQIDAAKELEMLPNWLLKPLENIEERLMSRVDLLSTISEGMIEKIKKKNIGDNEPYYLPNWADVTEIKPLGKQCYWLHRYLNISYRKKLIVYSGNVGEKQGLELLISVAKYLEHISDIHFVILGSGAYKGRLFHEIERQKLSNVSLDELVPVEDLNRMLNSSFLQLVLQKKGAEESFLPSKLTNIFAAGCASVVTAARDTSLYKLVERSKAGLIVQLGEPKSIAEGIKELLDKPERLDFYRKNARAYAVDNLNKDVILGKFENRLQEMLDAKMC